MYSLVLNTLLISIIVVTACLFCSSVKLSLSQPRSFAFFFPFSTEWPHGSLSPASANPRQIRITVSNRQVHVAQEMLVQVPVRKCLRVRGLNDRRGTCHGLLGAHSVPG